MRSTGHQHVEPEEWIKGNKGNGAKKAIRAVKGFHNLQ
jgi:hypothetical protein